ncbi:MAG: hypothetical protein AUJ96_01360 [Armatimonadetes bacterium CG2_30_66_41]|nr:MAG: hypothetical protein AUJ96_01360 [Armatimonadetes bacterium CG2_30_66_41]
MRRATVVAYDRVARRDQAGELGQIRSADDGDGRNAHPLSDVVDHGRFVTGAEEQDMRIQPLCGVIRHRGHPVGQPTSRDPLGGGVNPKQGPAVREPILADEPLGEGDVVARKPEGKLGGGRAPSNDCRQRQVPFGLMTGIGGRSHRQIQQRRTDAPEGLERLRTQADWPGNEHPSPAARLLEGSEETFTLNRLDLPESLRRCLATTNLFQSALSGTRSRTHRVTHWQDGRVTLRWAAAAALVTESNPRRIAGLWMLRARLDEGSSERKEVAIAARRIYRGAAANFPLR